VITTTKPASFGTSNSVGALEVCLKGRIGAVAAFNEAHGTVRVNVDYAVNGDGWTHSQLVSDSHMDAQALLTLTSYPWHCCHLMMSPMEHLALTELCTWG